VEGTTYTTNVTELNYTTDSIDSCWFSTDGGATNSTGVAAGINFTDVTSVEGSNTWTVYCNGSEGSDNVTFTKDTSGGGGGSNGSGFVNISIFTTVSITVDPDTIDFNSGQLDDGVEYAWVMSNHSTGTTNTSNGSWTGSASENGTSIIINNTGNVNISLNISSGSGADFLTGTDPKYFLKVIDADGETGSCTGGVSGPGIWIEIDSDGGEENEFCGELSPVNASDSIFVDAMLRIPNDANPGSSAVGRTDTLTITATAAG